jgi:hypothetical protein
MRRHYVWYLLAALWAAEAAFGFFRRSDASAGAAAAASACFFVTGFWMGRRKPVRGRRRRYTGTSPR